MNNTTYLTFSYEIRKPLILCNNGLESGFMCVCMQLKDFVEINVE